MKIKATIALSVLILSAQTSCVPLAVIGGAGAIGYTASKEKTFGATIDDTAIETKITAKYITNESKNLFTDITANSYEGRILLTGEAPSKEASIKAYNLAWEVKGVKEVINEIKVVPKTKFSAADLASDAWISTQIKSRLLFSKGISNQNYSIETVRGVVYMMGIAKDRSELNEVADIASQVPGVKKVVSYVRLKGNNKIISSGAADADRNSIPVTQENSTIPGSVKAGGAAASQGAASTNFKSGDLVIEESPNAQ